MAALFLRSTASPSCVYDRVPKRRDDSPDEPSPSLPLPWCCWCRLGRAAETFTGAPPSRTDVPSRAAATAAAAAAVFSTTNPKFGRDDEEKDDDEEDEEEEEDENDNDDDEDEDDA